MDRRRIRFRHSPDRRGGRFKVQKAEAVKQNPNIKSSRPKTCCFSIPFLRNLCAFTPRIPFSPATNPPAHGPYPPRRPLRPAGRAALRARLKHFADRDQRRDHRGGFKAELVLAADRAAFAAATCTRISGQYALFSTMPRICPSMRFSRESALCTPPLSAVWFYDSRRVPYKHAPFVLYTPLGICQDHFFCRQNIFLIGKCRKYRSLISATSSPHFTALFLYFCIIACPNEKVCFIIRALYLCSFYR